MTKKLRVCYIYGLISPEYSQDVFYVGKTVNPRTRLNAHRARLKVEGIGELAVSPKVISNVRMSILEVVPARKSSIEAESYWIREGIRRGWPLTNGMSSIRIYNRPLKEAYFDNLEVIINFNEKERILMWLNDNVSVQQLKETMDYYAKRKGWR